MRKLVALGTCDWCMKRGAVWQPSLRVLNFGTGLIMEPQAVGPTLCDDCEDKYRAQENAESPSQEPQ